jgi:hypothetical protein
VVSLNHELLAQNVAEILSEVILGLPASTISAWNDHSIKIEAGKNAYA